MPSLLQLCGCLHSETEDIKELDYQHCSLSDVPGEVFTFERTLEELHLDSNQISDLPVSLFHCHSLRYLSLADNELQTLPPAIASLIHLHTLDVSKNAITNIPDNINGCKQLRSVDASVNPLSKLPDGFTQLIALQELYLSDTFLEYLPANFGRLSRLRVLEVRENRLTSLPKSMSRLTHLQRLDLGQNDLSELPEVVGSLTSLTELLCDFNKLSALPPLVGNLTRLTHLDAANNKLRQLADELGRCTQLGYLQLSANNLRTMPESCGQLSHLITLKVDDNMLTSLPVRLGDMSLLEELNVSHNNITQLPASVGLLRRLSDLNMDENLLHELPSELGSCASLRVLSVRGNRLTGVPAELGHLARLRVLNLCSNRIPHLPCSLSKLHNLQALWLSPNQNKPLVRLQAETVSRGQRVLTCFMLPQHSASQEDLTDTRGAAEPGLSPEELAAARAVRSHITFALERGGEPAAGRLLRAPTPYPKELKELAKHARNLQRLHGRRPGQPPPPPPEEQKPLQINLTAGFDQKSPATVNDQHENRDSALDTTTGSSSPPCERKVAGSEKPPSDALNGSAGDASEHKAAVTASDGATAAAVTPSDGHSTPQPPQFAIPSTPAPPAAEPSAPGELACSAGRAWLPPTVASPPPYHVAASQSRMAGEFAHRHADPHRMLNQSLDLPASQLPPPTRLNETFDLADLRRSGSPWQPGPVGPPLPLGTPPSMRSYLPSRGSADSPGNSRPMSQPSPNASPTRRQRGMSASPPRRDASPPKLHGSPVRGARFSPARLSEISSPLREDDGVYGADIVTPLRLLGNPPRPLNTQYSEESSTPTEPPPMYHLPAGLNNVVPGPGGDAPYAGVSDRPPTEYDGCSPNRDTEATGTHPADSRKDSASEDGVALVSTINQITDYDSSTSDSAADPAGSQVSSNASQKREPFKAPLMSRIPRRQNSPARQESPGRNEKDAENSEDITAPVDNDRLGKGDISGMQDRNGSSVAEGLKGIYSSGIERGRSTRQEIGIPVLPSVHGEPRSATASQLPVRFAAPTVNAGQAQRKSDVPTLSREGSRSFLPVPRSRLESPNTTKEPASSAHPGIMPPPERLREPSYSQLPVPRSRLELSQTASGPVAATESRTSAGLQPSNATERSREASYSQLPVPRARLEAPSSVNDSAAQAESRLPSPALYNSQPLPERAREHSFSHLPVPRARLTSPYQTNGLPRPASYQTNGLPRLSSQPVNGVPRPSQHVNGLPRPPVNQVNGFPQPGRQAGPGLKSSARYALAAVHEPERRLTHGSATSQTPNLPYTNTNQATHDSSKPAVGYNTGSQAFHGGQTVALADSPHASATADHTPCSSTAGGPSRRAASTLSAGQSGSRIPVSARPAGGPTVQPAPAVPPRHGWPPPDFAPPDASYSQVEVTIEKNPDLGFSVAACTENDPHYKGVYISRVQADSSAWQRLRPGDRLLSVDGADVSAATHEQAVHTLLHTGAQLTLVVLRAQ